MIIGGLLHDLVIDEGSAGIDNIVEQSRSVLGSQLDLDKFSILVSLHT